MAAAEEQTLIFTYGTLKRGFPNHRLLLSISAALVSSHCSTSLPHPLVVGPNGVPFLLPLPGRGRRVSGEIYSLSSANALAAVDDLEGVVAGHYERMPIKVISEEGRQEEEREVMAYFAHKSYAGSMWRRCGEEAGAIGEYTAEDAAAFVPAAEWGSGATLLESDPDQMETEQTLIFTYGTLKRGFPNHHLLSTSAALASTHCSTALPHPLVVGPNGIPFLLPLRGRGSRVSGEIYSLTSAAALVAVDDLEGVGRGHYERMPIKVICEERGEKREREVMAYFAHGSYAERMWRRCGDEAGAIGEYTAAEAAAYVPPAERGSGSTFLGDVEKFLNEEYRRI